MFSEYDTFILKKAIEDTTVSIGARGVVLMVYEGAPQQYEVEFPDGTGGNIGSEISYTLPEEVMGQDHESP